MAKTTKPKGKPLPELHKWTVLANGQEVSVNAENMEVDSGTLIFWEGEHVAKAWANNAWTTVELQDPEPDPA